MNISLEMYNKTIENNDIVKKTLGNYYSEYIDEEGYAKNDLMLISAEDRQVKFIVTSSEKVKNCDNLFLTKAEIDRRRDPILWDERASILSQFTQVISSPMNTMMTKLTTEDHYSGHKKIIYGKHVTNIASTNGNKITYVLKDYKIRIEEL